MTGRPEPSAGRDGAPDDRWRDRLEALASRAAARRAAAGGPAPTWEEVRRRARNLSGAALALQLATAADEVLDASLNALPPDVAAAAKRVGVDLGVLDHYPPEALRGLVSTLTGALFELEVARATDAGVLELPDGVEHLRLGSFDTPGWDAELLDAHGRVVDHIQLKASDDAGVVVSHLLAHPDVPRVWTTAEAAADAHRIGLAVTDTGIANEQLRDRVTAAVEDATTVTWGELVDEIIPQVTLVVLAAVGILRVARGEPVREVALWVRDRAVSRTVTSAVAGLAAAVTGTDAARVPVVVAARLVDRALADLGRSAATVRGLRRVVTSLRPG